MNVCIVGGTSAIGRALSSYYACDGHVVTTVNRGDDSHRPFGPFDVLIVSVGSTVDARIESLTEHGWQESIEANLSYPFRMLKTFLPKMSDGGSVVIIGSVIGSMGGYGCAGYAAGKAGLVGLVRAAANENAIRGVCVNLLELGYVNAGMGAKLNPRIKEKIIPTIPLKRFAGIEEVVQSVDFLARAKYCTGNILTMAGGLR